MNRKRKKICTQITIKQWCMNSFKVYSSEALRYSHFMSFTAIFMSWNHVFI